MEKLTVDTSKTITSVLLKRLISPEEVAAHFKLEGRSREALLQETSRALQHLDAQRSFQETLHLFAPRLHQCLSAMAQEPSSEIKINPLQKTANAASKQNVSPYEISSVVEMGALLTPSLMLASAVLDILNNPNQLRDREHVVKCTTSLLVNTHQIVQHSAVQGLTLAMGSIAAVGVGVGVGLMREYRFRLDKRAHQEQLQQTIVSAEDAYLEIHKRYAIMCMAYQAKTNDLKAKSEFDEADYRQTIDLWLATERYYQGQIQHHQKEIASISALNQRMQSSHRLDRAMDMLNTFLTLTAFSGPPGLLAATIIRTFAGIGMTLGNLVIQETARFNHGIRHDNSVVLLSDMDSIDAAIDVLGHTIHPFIGLSGPILRPLTIAGFNIDKWLHTHASLAKKLVMQAQGRQSCSFSFLSNLPDIPQAERRASVVPYALNRDMRQADNKVLKALTVVADNLIEEAFYLWFLGWKHREVHTIWPYVVNYQDLIFALSDSAQEIDEQLAVILNYMGGDTVKTQEETHLIADIQRKIAVIQHQCKNDLHIQYLELQKTPHHVLFKEGMAIHLQEACPTEIQTIKDTYFSCPEARSHWLNEICFHLNAMTRLIDSCLLMSGTRYIQNLNQVILELRSHLDVLNQMYIDHDRADFPTQELNRCERAKNMLHRIVMQNQLLMQRREMHITQNPNGLDCPQDRYVELVKLQHQRLLGNRVTPSILEESKHPNCVSQRFLSHLESRLVHPTPVDLQDLEDVRMISPHRVFFGIHKHQDMQRDVNDKLDGLLSSKVSTLRLQIMPLQGIDERILASCQSNYQRLKDLIEGLKTEIQWVTQLKHVSEHRNVKLLNLDSVYDFYQQQLNLFRKICLNKQAVLGEPPKTAAFFSTLSCYKTQVQNSLHEHVFHHAEIQLIKAENLLAQWHWVTTEQHHVDPHPETCGHL